MDAHAYTSTVRFASARLHRNTTQKFCLLADGFLFINKIRWTKKRFNLLTINSAWTYEVLTCGVKISNRIWCVGNCSSGVPLFFANKIQTFDCSSFRSDWYKMRCSLTHFSWKKCIVVYDKKELIYTSAMYNLCVVANQLCKRQIGRFFVSLN